MYIYISTQNTIRMHIKISNCDFKFSGTKMVYICRNVIETEMNVSTRSQVDE